MGPQYKVRKAINSMGVEMELIEKECYIEEDNGKMIAHLKSPPIALYSSVEFFIPHRLDFEVVLIEDEKVTIKV